jgi:hypothetical protein
LYQHRVSPFELADPSKPGYRKILVLFLVDPHLKVTSATDVAPQQRSWLRAAVNDAPVGSLWRRLPVEILDIIIYHSFTMTEEEAKAYRVELMEERTLFVDVVDRQHFGQQFNMWYAPSLWKEIHTSYPLPRGAFQRALTAIFTPAQSAKREQIQRMVHLCTLVSTRFPHPAFKAIIEHNGCIRPARSTEKSNCDRMSIGAHSFNARKELGVWHIASSRSVYVQHRKVTGTS